MYVYIYICVYVCIYIYIYIYIYIHTHIYFQEQTAINEKVYEKQKHFCSRFFKKQRRKSYNNLDLSRVTNYKIFWKIVKTLLSNKGKSLEKCEKVTLKLKITIK